MKNKLTDKQAKFVREYMIDLNATQAAIRAGYSKKTAFSIGVENLNKPLISQAIASHSKKSFDRNEISVDRILQELSRMAFLDMSEAFDKNGNLLNVKKMPKDIVAAIGGLEVTKNDFGDNTKSHLSKVKLIEKTKALDLLGKYHALWVDKKQIEVKEPIKLFINGK